jgi:signal transduction histidine kinase/CheY-like chemotaxis protein
MSCPQDSLKILCLQSQSEDILVPLREEEFHQKIEVHQVKTKDDLELMLNHQSWDLVVTEFISDKRGDKTFYDLVLRSNPTKVLKRFLSEERLIHEDEAVVAKEQMLAVVSHDIKNPLSAIHLEAQMLLRAADRANKSLFSEEVKIQANRILKTTIRMKALIADLLDRSKAECSLQKLHKTEVHLKRLVQEVIDSLRPIASEKNIMIEMNLQEDSRVHADRSKLYQVFSNLLSNALKFSPSGKVVRILERQTESDFLFSIEDSGTGLSPTEKQKVFDKFWTGEKTQANGTGLGLFITKTIVEAHGGKIGVENLTTGGASFHFNLPKGSQAPHVTLESFLVPGDERKLILLVDDDDDLREVIAWVLEKEGFLVKSFSSPKNALNVMAQLTLRPDLVIVDFHMNEINGSDLVKKIRQLTGVEDLPVMLITASPLDIGPNDERELYKEVITKPVDLEGLVNSALKMTGANAP